MACGLVQASYLAVPGEREVPATTVVVERPGSEVTVRVRAEGLRAYRHFQRGVRTDRWKLILYNVGGKQTTQLFDLEKDPLEMTNLAASQPEQVKKLRALLQDWMKRTEDDLDLDKPDWGYQGKGGVADDD